MSVWVTKESEMQQIRKEVTFCYLCGCCLHSGRRSKNGNNRDHILPQALFGAPPTSEAWRPILNAHVQCHEETKNKEGEEVAVLLHKFQTLDGKLAEKNWASNLKALGLELRKEFDPHIGETLHLVKGFGSAHDAVWHWIRGLHAVLYREYLPPLMKHRAFAPMGEANIPDSGDSKRRIGPEEIFKEKTTISEVLSVACHNAQFDGVRCWGNRCQYMCVWAQIDRQSPFCMWSLLYDGVTDYAKGAPFSGTPWMGIYECVRPPKHRTTVDSLIVSR